eukprot:gnl/MRDRNA2_/MRDRNA2_85287_c0_seq1.p1 gnl/MRDRNA2_/MRDRNA2_85287_c0~~gnl/MRDRNA2_/MRDRNA2_85287_c0_seq1.p1  ORF type:complete len:607 (+),score=56.37 gnl/MRDRNA2_/MRDRNA2_85287_c0_seq1:272-1822(+)
MWVAALPTVITLGLSTTHEILIGKDIKWSWGPRFLRSSEFVPITIFSFICGYFVWLPGHLKPRCLDAANVALGAVWIWKTAMLYIYTGTGHFHYQQAWIMFCRTFQGIIFGNAVLTSLLNVVWVLCDIFLFALLEFEAPESGGHTEQNIGYVYRQIVLGAGAVGLSWAFESTRYAEVNAAWTAEKTKESYSQVSRVLGAMCDCVVGLDSSLCVTGGPINGVAKLKSLLMLTSEPHGKPFTTVISSRDRERVVQYIRGESKSASHRDERDSRVQSCHLHLIDKYGLPVAVQLFCSALLGQDDKPIYLVGIREDSDAEVAGVRAMRQQEALATSPVTNTPEASLLGLSVDFSTDDVRGDASRPGHANISAGRRRNPARSGSGSTRHNISSGNSSSSSSSAGGSGPPVSSNRGTAPHPKAHDVGTIQDGDIHGHGGCRRGTGYYRGFSITPVKAIKDFLVAGMLRVNVHPGDPYAVQCCQWHLSLWSVKCALKDLAAMKCKTSWSPVPLSMHSVQDVSI